MQRIDYNVSILDDLRPGNELYDDIMYVDKNFGGTLPLEIVIDSNGNSIYDMEFLNKAEEFEKRVEDLPDIK